MPQLPHTQSVPQRLPRRHCLLPYLQPHPLMSSGQCCPFLSRQLCPQPVVNSNRYLHRCRLQECQRALVLCRRHVVALYSTRHNLPPIALPLRLLCRQVDRHCSNLPAFCQCPELQLLPQLVLASTQPKLCHQRLGLVCLSHTQVLI